MRRVRLPWPAAGHRDATAGARAVRLAADGAAGPVAPLRLHRLWPCLAAGLRAAALPRAKLSSDAVLWALKSLVLDRLSVARIAAALGAAWHTVNDAVLTAGRELLIADPHRLDGGQVLGVDEHCWRHPRPDRTSSGSSPS